MIICSKSLLTVSNIILGVYVRIKIRDKTKVNIFVAHSIGVFNVSKMKTKKEETETVELQYSNLDSSRILCNIA